MGCTPPPEKSRGARNIFLFINHIFPVTTLPLPKISFSPLSRGGNLTHPLAVNPHFGCTVVLFFLFYTLFSAQFPMLLSPFSFSPIGEIF